MKKKIIKIYHLLNKEKEKVHGIILKLLLLIEQTKMKISDLIRELQEIQSREGNLPVNIIMNGYYNGDSAIISEKDDDFDFYVGKYSDATALLLEGDSRDLDAGLER